MEAPPLWMVDPHAPQPEIIRLAASAVLAEGVIIYPTETLYGLGANPLSEEAVKKVYRVKGRDFDKPLPLIAANRAAALSAVARWTDLAEVLAESFWPGPLTLVLAASPRLPALIHAGTGKIGVRVSSHPVARVLAEASGGLITATSANESGQPASP
ncbi:MAG: L-threonylcarbamoyladenylate synthase, partial [Acidobacteriota bacterium]